MYEYNNWHHFSANTVDRAYNDPVETKEFDRFIRVTATTVSNPRWMSPLTE